MDLHPAQLVLTISHTTWKSHQSYLEIPCTYSRKEGGMQLGSLHMVRTEQVSLDVRSQQISSPPLPQSKQQLLWAN